MQQKNIVLIGMPASGKSTIGVLLAKALGVGFLDTDLLIQQQEKSLLQEIIDQKGITYFLDAESKAICSLSMQQSVIATGGSAVLREEAMQKLQQNGTIILIDVPLPILKRRLHNIKTRGVAAEKDKSIEDIYAERMPLYKKYAAFSVVSDAHSSIETTVSNVLSLLNENNLL